MGTTEKVRTVADRLAENEEWRARIVGMREQHGDAWVTRALKGANIQRERLLEWPTDQPLLSLEQAAFRPGTVVGGEERAVIRWQHRDNLKGILDPFEFALYEAITYADDTNLAKLALGFPVEVTGIQRYRTESGWADTVRGLPIDFDL